MIRVVAVGASVGVFLVGVGAAALILGRKALEELDDNNIWEMNDR